MSIATVPAYLGQDFKEASPGMRFGMYLPIWTNRRDQEAEVNQLARKRSREGQELNSILESRGIDDAIAHMGQRKHFPQEWEKNDHASREAWKNVSEIRPDDRKRMEALGNRQSALASALPDNQRLSLDALAVAPFTTGLGNEHPLENGFAFLWPYGLPYLPGTGVKGVLRQAARELAADVDDPGIANWDVQSDWSQAAIDALFGKEDSNDAQRGALAFWDVIPRIKGESLAVEVMTGHQGHYYMQGQTPHESGQPIPINFLTVPAGSGFSFHIVCDLPFLRRIAPQLGENDHWKALLQQAFAHAFDWLGFGAKTAVGYGAMAIDRQAAAEREEIAAEKAFEALSEEAKLIQSAREIFAAEKERGQLEGGCQTAQKRMELLKAAKDWQPEERQQAVVLIEEITRHLPWSKKQKKQGINKELEALRHGE